MVYISEMGLVTCATRRLKSSKEDFLTRRVGPPILQIQPIFENLFHFGRTILDDFDQVLEHIDRRFIY